MTQYNSFNVKIPNSQLSKSKSAIINQTEVVVRLLWNMIYNFDDETNFLHNLLLTDELQIFAKFLKIIYQLMSRYQISGTLKK